MPAIMVTACISNAEKRVRVNCPFYGLHTDICTASCSTMLVDERTRGKYCGNEDFDDCPIFLVKTMVRKR